MGWKDDRKKYFVLDEQTKQYARIASNAKTTLELSKACQRMYIADYINLEGVDLRLAKYSLTAVYRILKDYPALKSQINYFGNLKGFVTQKDKLFAFLNKDADDYVKNEMKKLTDQTAMNAKNSLVGPGLALAFLTAVGNYRFSGVIIDETDFDEQKILEDLKYSEKAGHNPKNCCSVKSVVDHELGHLLDYWLDLRTNPEIIEPLRQAGPFYVQKNLSLYSVQNGYIDYAEAIAEGFSEARNNPKPRRLAQIIKATIDKSYQRKLIEIENQENRKYKKNSRIVWEKNK